MSTELFSIRPVFTGFHGDGGNRTHAKCLPIGPGRPVVGVGSEDQIGPARCNARPVATEDQAPMRAEGYSATKNQRRPCFYCGRTLHHFDRDHSPVPKRHGGTDVVLACLHCHSLKDRQALSNWSPGEHEAIERGATLQAAAFIAYCVSAAQGGDVVLDLDSLTTAAESCTTAEARIAVYKAFNAALDATKGAALEEVRA